MTDEKIVQCIREEDAAYKEVNIAVRRLNDALLGLNSNVEVVVSSRVEMRQDLGRYIVVVSAKCKAPIGTFGRREWGVE